MGLYSKQWILWIYEHFHESREKNIRYRCERALYCASG